MRRHARVRWARPPCRRAWLRHELPARQSALHRLRPLALPLLALTCLPLAFFRSFFAPHLPPHPAHGFLSSSSPLPFFPPFPSLFLFFFPFSSFFFFSFFSFFFFFLFFF